MVTDLSYTRLNGDLPEAEAQSSEGKPADDVGAATEVAAARIRRKSQAPKGSPDIPILRIIVYLCLFWGPFFMEPSYNLIKDEKDATLSCVGILNVT